jgi:hypothetical protein
MRILARLPALVLLAALPLLSGCLGGIQQEIDASIADARRELREEPLSLQAEGHPDAEITRAGELRIGDAPVALDADQQRAVLAYRDTVLAVADAGLDGGAKIAHGATGAMMLAVLTGNEDRMERRIEASANRLVRGLCPGIAGVRRVQEDLVRQVPQFAPYAERMDDDLDECRRSEG